MTTTLQHWQARITAVAFTSLTGAFGLNLAIGQFIAPLMDSLAWSLAATSTVVAVNTLAWGLFQPLAGRLIDRIGPRQVMAGSASLMGLSYVTLATVTEYWQFLILFGVVVAAGFAGCSSMPSSVLVARWHTKSRPRALAVSSMGINAGQLLLLPLAGVLVTMLGWRAAFLALGAIMLALVVPVLWFGARNSPSDVGIRSDDTLEPAGAPTTLRDALSDRQFWTISLSFAGCGYSLYLFTTHMPKLALELSGTGVTVTALLPGWVRTEFHQRAGISATSLPSFVWIDADDLVRQCLRDVEKGRIESVPTKRWKASLFIADHGPRKFIRWFSHKLSASRRKR